MENKTYTVFQIADWFLSKSAMTPKKLQKIVYYAYAWGNALLKYSIIDDTKYEAWVHGPVAPELYNKYREYGWTDIEKYNGDLNIDDGKVQDLLESVWETYGDQTANSLEALTHQEDPWKNARKGLAEGEISKNEISTDDMAAYYSSIYIGD